MALGKQILKALIWQIWQLNKIFKALDGAVSRVGETASRIKKNASTPNELETRLMISNEYSHNVITFDKDMANTLHLMGAQPNPQLR